MSLISTQMFHNISTDDFIHHVRHATSWNDLGIRCGLEPDKFGEVHDNRMKKCRVMSMLRQKVQNMRLSIEHFFGRLQPTLAWPSFFYYSYPNMYWFDYDNLDRGIPGYLCDCHYVSHSYVPNEERFLGPST